MAKPTDSAPLTLADLRRTLDVKEQELRALIDRKDALAEELDQLGATLEAMLLGGGAAPGRARSKPAAKKRSESSGEPARGGDESRKAPARRGRAAGTAQEGSLEAFLRSVLERVVGPMRVGELATAVQQAGYVSSSKNLPIMVANRLSEMDDVERVERGLYQLRRSGADAAEAGTAS